jgi:hypothetical protein
MKGVADLKKNYIEPEVEISFFMENDIICSSGYAGEDKNGDSDEGDVNGWDD